MPDHPPLPVVVCMSVMRTRWHRWKIMHHARRRTFVRNHQAHLRGQRASYTRFFSPE